MGETSTERFLRLLNEQNTAIAAREAELEAAKPKPDLIRLQREQERREKWGELRARERPSKRPHRSRNVFPYSNPM
jgi:hypothetical protein